ncbi:MAG: pyridoxamine 5'-phosphate oxidase family protein [Dehalococcoidia bacterium]|nr:pyridoxamine 5'-phosphate oxidase family protein [Dehalococcoidia bacterium]
MPGPDELLRNVIGGQYFAVLNTLGNGLPHSSLISFAVTDDLRSLVFVTGRNTRKYRNIRENGNVSLLIDNRTNQPSDISEAIAITASGSASEEVSSATLWWDVFLSRHPQLRQFVEAPDTAIIVVAVREYAIARFDETQRVSMSE